MKKIRWQLLIIFLTATVVGVLLLNEQPEPVTPLSSPEPVQGGVYTEALVGSPMRLNPLLAYFNPADRDVSRLIFSGLLRLMAMARRWRTWPKTGAFLRMARSIMSPFEKMPFGTMANRLQPMM
jgi:hypothetical protein